MRNPIYRKKCDPAFHTTQVAPGFTRSDYSPVQALEPPCHCTYQQQEKEKNNILRCNLRVSKMVYMASANTLSCISVVEPTVSAFRYVLF